MMKSEADQAALPGARQRLPMQLEEVLNALSHGLGAILSVVGFVALLALSPTTEDVWRLLSASIFGLSLFALYFASMLYHATRCPVKKDKYKTLDHCAIYLLIAGSYTPFLLVNMRDTVGIWMMALVWGIALAGVLLKLRFKHRFKILRVGAYLLMGWLVVISGDELVASLSTGGLVLLAAGGIIYTLGVIFYLGHKIPYNHAIWHCFVLGGSVCHYYAVYYHVMPLGV